MQAGMQLTARAAHAAPARRISAPTPTRCCAPPALGHRRRAVRRIGARVVVLAAQDSDSEPDDGGDGGATTAVMSMAESLVERARAAAASGVADADFAAAFVPELEAELAALAARAAAAEASASAAEEVAKAAKDQFVRLSADFDNFRKRTAAEGGAARAAAKADVLSALLPLVDAFEGAKAQLRPESEGERKIDAAYQALYKQTVEILRAQGVEAVPGEGAPFDPELHEAIMREPRGDVPDGTVLQEFRKGFRLGERLLRAAMVQVSYNDGDAGGGGEGDGGGDDGGVDAAGTSDSE